MDYKKQILDPKDWDILEQVENALEEADNLGTDIPQSIVIDLLDLFSKFIEPSNNK